MKIRYGFVSNSSTTSFCIYGSEFDFDTVRQLCKSIESIKKEFEVELDNEENNDLFEIIERFEVHLNKAGLSSYSNYDGASIFIGKKLSGMKDDQTFGSFKSETKDLIEKALGRKDFRCGVIEETISS